MEFLGHQIGGDVITPSRSMENSSNHQEASEILPWISRAFAVISAPLSDLLKKGKSEQVQWNEAQEHVHSLLKKYLLQK